MPEVTLLADCWAGILFLTAGIHYHSHFYTLCLPTECPNLWRLDQLWRGKGEEGKQTSIYWKFGVCQAPMLSTFLFSLTPQRNSERSMPFPPINKWRNWYWEAQGYNTKRSNCMAPKSMFFPLYKSNSLKVQEKNVECLG